MMLTRKYNGKTYKVLTPSVFRRIVSHYWDYEVRIVSGDTYLVHGNDDIDDYLVDVLGYPRGDKGSPVKLESFD